MRNMALEAFRGLFEGTSMEIFNNIVRNGLTFENADAAAAGAIFELLQPIGYAIIIALFLMEFLNETTMRDHVTIETYIRMLCKLLIAEMLISHGGEIIGSVMGFSNYMLNKSMELGLATTMSAAANGETDFDAFFDSVKINTSSTLGVFIIAMFTKALMTVIVTGTAIVVSVMTLAVKIEMILRLGIAGIGFASVFDGGTRSNGVQYLKKILACAMYAFGMVLVFDIATGMSGSNMAEELNDITEINITVAFEMFADALLGLVYPIAAVGALTTVKSILKEAWG